MHEAPDDQARQAPRGCYCCLPGATSRAGRADDASRRGPRRPALQTATSAPEAAPSAMQEPRIAPVSAFAPAAGVTRLVGRRVVCLDGSRLPRKLSAYHEAAHAVVARKLGCIVAYVNIAAATARGGKCVHVT